MSFNITKTAAGDSRFRISPASDSSSVTLFSFGNPTAMTNNGILTFCLHKDNNIFSCAGALDWTAIGVDPSATYSFTLNGVTVPNVIEGGNTFTNIGNYPSNPSTDPLYASFSAVNISAIGLYNAISTIPSVGFTVGSNYSQAEAHIVVTGGSTSHTQSEQDQLYTALGRSTPAPLSPAYQFNSSTNTTDFCIKIPLLVVGGLYFSNLADNLAYNLQYLPSVNRIDLVLRDFTTNSVKSFVKDINDNYITPIRPPQTVKDANNNVFDVFVENVNGSGFNFGLLCFSQNSSFAYRNNDGMASGFWTQYPISISYDGMVLLCASSNGGATIRTATNVGGFTVPNPTYTQFDIVANLTNNFFSIQDDCFYGIDLQNLVKISKSGVKVVVGSISNNQSSNNFNVTTIGEYQGKVIIASIESSVIDGTWGVWTKTYDQSSNTFSNWNLQNLGGNLVLMGNEVLTIVENNIHIELANKNATPNSKGVLHLDVTSNNQTTATYFSPYYSAVGKNNTLSYAASSNSSSYTVISVVTPPTGPTALEIDVTPV